MTGKNESSTAAMSSASATFIRHSLAIDKSLARLAEHQANHFGVGQKTHANWAEVEIVEHARKLLEQTVALLEGDNHQRHAK